MAGFAYPRILGMATPRMKDEDKTTGGAPMNDVSPAQKLLYRNRLTQNSDSNAPEDGGGEFYHADQPQHRDEDGVFGEFTGKAAQKARYFLGYPKRGKNSWKRRRFDQLLADRLEPNEKALPRIYRVRRSRRLKRAQQQNSFGGKALAAGKKRIGEMEHPPGSNRCATTAWYGFVGAWCLMFVSRCYVDAGSKLFKRGVWYAYNPTLWHVAKSGKDGLELVPLSKARPGDIVQFDWNDGTEPPDHAALFMDRVGNQVRTLDGNWDSRVAVQMHPASAVMDVIRVFE